MPRKIDYLNDPAGTKPTTIVPTANVAVVNDAGELLVIRRANNDN